MFHSSRSTSPRRVLGALAAAVVLAAAPAARSDPAHASTGAAEPAPAAAHHHFIVGANALMLGAINHGHMVGEVGPGGFFELVAIPDWVELELCVHYLRTTTNVSEVPIDLVLKKPFHPLRWLNPYIGLGPTVIPAFAPHESSVHVGVATEVGSYFWLTPHLGLSAEIDYGLVADHGLVQEVGATSGVVFGF